MLAATSTGDCETGEGWLAQPANALSSLALVGVGAWIAWRARRAPALRLEAALFGAAVALVGVASLVLHGPAPAWAGWAHDVSIAWGLFLTIAIDSRLLGAERRRTLAIAAVASVSAAVAFGAFPDAQRSVYTVAAVVFGFLELRCLRGGLHRRGPWAVAAVLFAAASVSFFLGKDASPLCDPSGLLQAHALWHLLEAAALGSWSLAVFPRDPSPAR
jgi:hypothetical protein